VCRGIGSPGGEISPCTWTEGQFLSELLERTDALLVLDAANV
jgi:hypothetical protein